jgi:enoyl-CoA hydratase/carnithine racemase
MNFNFKTLQVEKLNKHILIVTLNRPEVRNAINNDMIMDFQELWKQVSEDRSELRCIILTGVNPAFCAGADLKERKNLSLEKCKLQLGGLRNTILAMQSCALPVISAVNGAAFGGGLEIVLASDFAYAANIATFSQSEVKIGIIPGALGTQNLPKSCGLARAKELVFTAITFTADQAYQWGIVNKVCQSEKLMDEAIATATLICANAPIAIREAKRAMNIALQVDIETGFSKEFEAYQCALETKDRDEGLRAFHEKRKPIFIGQ